MEKKYTIGEFCWNELATPDVNAAKAFYSSVFGWEFTDHDTGDTTYTMIKLKDKEFGGFWQIPKEKTSEIPPHWMSYILVENLETTLQKAKDQGATVKKPITKAGEYGHFAIIMDPIGAHIAMWQPMKK